MFFSKKSILTFSLIFAALFASFDRGFVTGTETLSQSQTPSQSQSQTPSDSQQQTDSQSAEVDSRIDDDIGIGEQYRSANRKGFETVVKTGHEQPHPISPIEECFPLHSNDIIIAMGLQNDDMPPDGIHPKFNESWVKRQQLYISGLSGREIERAIDNIKGAENIESFIKAIPKAFPNGQQIIYI